MTELQILIETLLILIAVSLFVLNIRNVVIYKIIRKALDIDYKNVTNLWEIYYKLYYKKYGIEACYDCDKILLAWNQYTYPGMLFNHLEKWRLKDFYPNLKILSEQEIISIIDKSLKAEKKFSEQEIISIIERSMKDGGQKEV